MKVKLSLEQEKEKDPRKEEETYVQFLEKIYRNFPTAIWWRGKDCFEIEF